MKIFKSKSSHLISGRGHVKIVNIPSGEILPHVGEIVSIDGSFFKVLGIELTKLLTDPPKRHEDVGLLLGKADT